MTLKNENIDNDYDDSDGKEDNITNKAKVSACGCDTDHHDGKYINTVYKSKRIYFCALNCKEEFLEDPEAFLASYHFVLEFELLEDA